MPGERRSQRADARYSRMTSFQPPIDRIKRIVNGAFRRAILHRANQLRFAYGPDGGEIGIGRDGVWESPEPLDREMANWVTLWLRMQFGSPESPSEERPLELNLNGAVYPGRYIESVSADDEARVANIFLGPQLPADYVIIRERLDRPLATTWDPCAPDPAVGSTDWPDTADEQANADHLERCFAELPHKTRVRAALAAIKSPESNQYLRDELQQVVHWLEGRYHPRSFGQAFTRDSRSPEHDTEGPVRRLVTLAARPDGDLDLAVQAIWSAWYFDAANAGVRSGPRDVVMVAFYREVAAFWTRCCALLPVKDVAAADIEWSDLRLVPQPGAWQPPGDLPTWVPWAPHQADDEPGPIGAPIPPEQWTDAETLLMVDRELAMRTERSWPTSMLRAAADRLRAAGTTG